jgi:hypothetical protein
MVSEHRRSLLFTTIHTCCPFSCLPGLIMLSSLAGGLAFSGAGLPLAVLGASRVQRIMQLATITTTTTACAPHHAETFAFPLAKARCFSPEALEWRER